MESLGKNGKPVHKSHKSKEQARFCRPCIFCKLLGRHSGSVPICKPVRRIRKGCAECIL